MKSRRLFIFATFAVLVLAGGMFYWLAGPSKPDDGLDGRLAEMKARHQAHVRKQAAVKPGARPGAVPLAAGIGSAQAPGEARDFVPLNDEGTAALQDLLRQYAATADNDEKRDLLDQMAAQAYGRELLSFLRQILTTEKDPELRLAALELLAGNTSPDILPLLEVALQDMDADVRLNAVIAASRVSSGLLEFAGRVFAHPEENTRLAGLDILEHQSVTTRVGVLAQALDSGHKELQIPAIGQLQLESSHQAVEALIRHVDAADADVREEVRFTLRFLLDEDFENAAAAHAWWQSHKREFDAELIRQ